MLCWSINVIKWKIRQGRGVWNGNMLAKIGLQFRLYLFQSCLGLFFSSSLHLNTASEILQSNAQESPRLTQPTKFWSCQRAHLFNNFTENFHREGKKWQDSKSPVWQLRRPDLPPTSRSLPWHGVERNQKRDHQTSQNVTPTDWTEEEEESLDRARGTWWAHRVSILIRLRWDCKGFAAATVNETCSAVAAKTRLDSCLAVTYISHRRSGF